MDPIETGRHWNEIADQWTELARGGYDFYRDGLNTPAFLEMLPEVSGLRGLDVRRVIGVPVIHESCLGSGQKCHRRTAVKLAVDFRWRFPSCQNGSKPPHQTPAEERAVIATFFSIYT